METLLLPLTWPDSAHRPPRQLPQGPDQDLLFNGDSGIELVVKEALQLPLSFRLQVFQEELVAGQAAVDPGAHKHSMEVVSKATGKTLLKMHHRYSLSTSLTVFTGFKAQQGSKTT